MYIASESLIFMIKHKKLLIDKAGQIWLNQPLTGKQVRKEIDFELQKKILSVFNVGDFYYYVFNVVDLKFDFVSEDVKNILGFSPHEFNLSFYLERIHPDDKPLFLNYENAIRDFFSKLPTDKFFKYKVRYDYRMQKKDGSYIRILHQVITINYSIEGGILHTFGVHTDISHLKNSNSTSLAIIGLDGEPSYFNYPVKTFVYDSENKLFSNRELEILNLLWEGKESKQIASELSLSPETVNTHRRNMLAKAQAKNTIELIRFAMKEGIL